MEITSQEKEMAKELIELFKPNMPYANTEMWAANCASICVDRIKKALETTTGHCELRLLDRQEVQSDMDFWDGVKKEIEKYK